jgi:hypothetical protein
MSFYEQNIAVLTQIFPSLAEKIEKVATTQANNTSLLKIETAASGYPTLLVDGLYVHSKRDPEREAQRLAEAVMDMVSGTNAGAEDDDVPVLVLGFGLGYAATALAQKYPARPLIIVEKRSEILKKALELKDLTAFLKRENLVFVLDSEGVTDALSLFKSSPGIPPLVLRNPALTSLDSEWYAAVDEKIAAWMTRTNVNQATKKRFGKRWVKNLSKNLPAVVNIPGISHLRDILSEANIPVFLAAAGPSLDDVSPVLSEVYKRCLVIAVDTSLRFLLRHGINPDFMLSVDPQFWNSRHLDWASAPKTRLVAESAVYPSLLRHSFEGAFLCGSFFPLGRFVEDRVDPKGDLGTGGSVATSAWDFVRTLGAKTVWISGLDLSFPESKTHFKGARFEEKYHAESGRFSTGETFNFRLLRDGASFWAKSSGGGAVLTDKRLSLYASWFENRFRQYPELQNYSLSPGGLLIKGFQIKAKDELLSLPERRKEIEDLLKRTFKAIKDDFDLKKAREKRVESYKKACETLFTGLKEIKTRAEEAALCARAAAGRCKLGHLDKNEQEKALAKLDAANKTITKSAVKDITGFLFPETGDWDVEIAAAYSDPMVRYLEFSSRFYKALTETADYNLKVLLSAPLQAIL